MKSEQIEITLPLDYEIFCIRIRRKYPDCAIRIMMCDGIYKLSDQMLHPNRVDIVIEDGKVTKILQEPFSHLIDESIPEQSESDESDLDKVEVIDL